MKDCVAYYQFEEDDTRVMIMRNVLNKRSSVLLTPSDELSQSSANELVVDFDVSVVCNQDGARLRYVPVDEYARLDYEQKQQCYTIGIGNEAYCEFSESRAANLSDMRNLLRVTNYRIVSHNGTRAYAIIHAQ